jgi:hypothetical protein
LPFPKRTSALLASPAIPYAIVPIAALDATRAIVPAKVPVLDPTRRIVRINFSQFDLGQDHARKPVKQLFHILSVERRDFDSDRYAI